MPAKKTFLSIRVRGTTQLDVEPVIEGRALTDWVQTAVEALGLPATYVASIQFNETDEPVVSVLYNSLGGAIVWTVEDVGVFRGTLLGAFPEGRTFCASPSVGLESDNQLFRSGNFERISNNEVELRLQNNELQPTDSGPVVTVEIRVYPAS